MIQDDCPLHFSQEYYKFHAFWDSQEANIVQDLLPATALDAMFTMIARYVKYLMEVQLENNCPACKTYKFHDYSERKAANNSAKSRNRGK